MAFNIQTYKTKGLLQGDMTVWVALIMLCIISIIEVYSASSGMSYKTGQYWKPMADHGTFVVIGLFVTWIVHQIPCKLFKLLSLGLILLSFFMLIWAIGSEKTNDAGRWISIAGKTFQPSEFAKLAIIGYIAYIMSTHRDEKNKISSLGLKMICAVSVPFLALIGMENFSTAGLLALVIFGMLVIGEAPKKFMLTICLGAFILLGSLGTVLLTMSKDTAVEIGEKVEALHRLPTWVSRLHEDHTLPEDPNDYNVNDHQQVAHAKIAVATCNIVGRGPGKSIERDYLPQAFSDFIYAIIIEEGGLEFAILVMGMYLLLLYRSWRIASKCARPFPAYLVMGLSMMLVLQALINMGVAVGLLPVTGQTLPLVSKGGTSYIITCAYIGMILSVSRSAKKIEEAETQVAVARREDNSYTENADSEVNE